MLRNLLLKLGLRSSRAVSAECERIQSRFYAYLDHDLPPAERDRLDRHILKCNSCAAELAACRRAERALSSALTSIPAPGDLRAGFYTKLEQSRRSQRAAGFPVLAATALAGLLLVGSLAGIKVLSRDRAHSDQVAAIARPSDVPPRTPVYVAGITPVHPPRASRSHSATLARVDPSGPPIPVRRLRVRPATGIRMAAAGRRWRRGGVLGSEFSDLGKRLALANVAKSPLGAMRVARLQKEPGRIRMASRLSDALVLDSSVESPRGARSAGYSDGGKLVFTSMAARTDLHVSDEDREFMSSTHIDDGLSEHGKRHATRVDDENANPPEPVELPALP